MMSKPNHEHYGKQQTYMYTTNANYGDWMERERVEVIWGEKKKIGEYRR